ncbi:hypothetical protein TNCV_5133181 [Trichonephila clavipes]|nr:hypothetical protein TNCV_5133181 [Trichonephila clavipes]
MVDVSFQSVIESGRNHPTNEGLDSNLAPSWNTVQQLIRMQLYNPNCPNGDHHQAPIYFGGRSGHQYFYMTVALLYS